MATEDQTLPAAPTADDKIQPLNAPNMTVEHGVEVYTSSEEFARVHAVGLEQQKVDEEKRKAATETERLAQALNVFIKQYSDTGEIRKMGEKNKKSADHNLDVAADVVVVLKKIKTELRIK